MSLPDLPPAPRGDWPSWGNRLVQWLIRTKDKLTFITPGYSAHDDGVMLWNPETKSPVVSVDGEYVALILHDGHAVVSSDTDITPAAINTAYPIVWDSIALDQGVTLGTPASRIVFAKGGTFLMSFTVQLTSASASSKNVWFWPRVNGVDVPGATMKQTIHNNSETIVLSRTLLFDISPGDYIEAVYEADDTAVTLEAAPAGVNAPATPSVILSVTRIHQ